MASLWGRNDRLRLREALAFARVAVLAAVRARPMLRNATGLVMGKVIFASVIVLLGSCVRSEPPPSTADDAELRTTSGTVRGNGAATGAYGPAQIAPEMSAGSADGVTAEPMTGSGDRTDRGRGTGEGDDEATDGGP